MNVIDDIESVFQFGTDTLKSIGHIIVKSGQTATGMIDKVISALGETFSSATGFVSNLPYSVAGDGISDLSLQQAWQVLWRRHCKKIDRKEGWAEWWWEKNLQRLLVHPVKNK